MFLHKTIASFFGIGYIGKGSGTIAALVVTILIYFGIQANLYNNYIGLMLSILLFFIGVLSATQTEKIWGKDSKRIVIDEVFGMIISLLFIPLSFVIILLGFILFRLFDIYKPLGIKKAEIFPGGWGVMADDLVAGIYTNILLQIICFLKFNL